MAENNLNIAVIGTGTAGITTLSHLLAWLPQSCTITSVYDPDIPILGIGESTTTTIPEVLYYGAGFSLLHDSNELDCTVKNGVRYVNWRDKDFFTTIPPPHYAMHFNNFKIKEVCFEKFTNKWGEKFKIIQGKIDKILNESDKAVICLPEQRLEFDYIIDCRGYPEEYSDYELLDTIPVNHCVVHTIQEKGDWNYTYHTATPDGWMFGIPLQTRQGWGYLYNDNITSREQALDNQAKILGIDKASLNTREFSFKNYRAKKFVDNRLIKNGNRALFYEPLEALSGWFYDRVVRAFFDVAFTKQLSEAAANEMLASVAEDYELFICYMYHGGSKYDTEFWQQTKEKCNNRLLASDKFKYYVDFLKHIDHIHYASPSKIMPFPYKTWKMLDKDLGYNYFN